jgi:predicted short-subunit dehydrogenase-like oxidoreductase (DUF2520 family)
MNTDQILIVGPGRMGLAIGTALAGAGAVRRLIYYGRAVGPPPHPLFPSGTMRAEYRIGPQPVPPEIRAVILAVPDGQIADVAQALAQMGPAPAGCVALHLAGAVSTEPLSPLHAVGYAVGSLHPLQSVADPWTGGERLIGSAFALGGEPAALATARRIVAALGGRPLVIPANQRPNYHAAAVFASNYLVTLAATAVRILREVGVDEADALPAILPLMRGTLDNLQDLGLASALTGPIARGDLETVRAHLARLSPPDRALYCALGRETLQLAFAAGLDARRAAELNALLSAE